MPKRKVVLNGTRLVQFSPSEREARQILVYCSILSVGYEVYKDYKRYDEKSLYGYAQIVAGTYVLEEIPITQVNQRIFSGINLFSDLTQQITCARKEIRALETLITEQPTELPPAYPVPLILPLFEETGIAFKMLPGMSASVQIISFALSPNCDLSRERSDPGDERDPGVDEPEQSNDQDGDGLPDAPYGSSDDGNGLDQGEQPPEDAAIPSPGGLWYNTAYFADGSSVTAPFPGETDPTTKWTIGGQCSEGQEGESGVGDGPGGTDVTGISVYRDGIYFGCNEDFDRGKATATTFEYRYT